MQTGPLYDVLNVSSCQAKYKTTNDLDKLNQVKNQYLSSKIYLGF